MINTYLCNKLKNICEESANTCDKLADLCAKFAKMQEAFIAQEQKEKEQIILSEAGLHND